MKWTLPPELETALKKYYTASEPSPDFVSRLGLELRLHYATFSGSRMNNKRGFMNAMRLRPALAIVVAILALLLLSGVAYAIGRLSGFISGFGFASGDLYVLSAPVEITQNSVVIGVEQAVHDTSGFWVKATVRGLPDGDGYAQAYILLPSGEKLQAQRGGSVSPGADVWHLSYIFPALDDPSQPVRLLVEYVNGQTIETTFTLRPANTEEVLPAFSGKTLPVRGELLDHMALALDHVAMSTDRTVLQVSLQFDQPGITLAAPWSVTMTDDQGRIYPLTDISPETMDIGVTRLYQTVPLQGNEHLILKLVSFPSESDLPMLQDVSTDPGTFIFDPGTNPQVGQTWTLDETLQVGEFQLHVRSVRMASPTALVFAFEPTQNVTGVMLYATPASGAAGGGPVKNGHFTASMNFDQVPDSAFEVQVRGVYYTAHGPWQVEWQAPVPSVLSFPTMTPAPSPTPLIIPTAASEDPLLAEVQELARKFDQAIVQGPAWVHVLYEYSMENMPPSQTYPPSYSQDEQWYEIDESGWVSRNLTTHRDADGNILQQSVSIGTKGLNLTVGDVFEISPYHLSFDFLTRDLDSALQRRQPVLREETTCEDDSRCLLITIREGYDPPIQNPGQPLAFYGGGLRVWIDMETGQQVKLQSFSLLEDGTEHINYTQRALFVERVTTPPHDVLDILDKVVFPP